MSLLVPSVAAETRRHLGEMLDTPAGRFAELVVITEILQAISRGEYLELEEPVRIRLRQVL